VPTTTNPAPKPGTVGVRELGRNPSRVLARLGAGSVIVTSSGRPVAVLTGIDPGELEDFLLAHAYAADLAAADADPTAGRTIDLQDALAELGE
jgi:prevent-host-death family protein